MAKGIIELSGLNQRKLNLQERMMALGGFL